MKIVPNENDGGPMTRTRRLVAVGCWSSAEFQIAPSVCGNVLETVTGEFSGAIIAPVLLYAMDCLIGDAIRGETGIRERTGLPSCACRLISFNLADNLSATKETCGCRKNSKCPQLTSQISTPPVERFPQPISGSR